MKNARFNRGGPSFKSRLVGYYAEARSGGVVKSSVDSRAEVFVRHDGDRWSADRFISYFLKKKEKKITDYAPPTLSLAESDIVEFPFEFSQAGMFRIETGGGPVDVSRVVVRVEFRRTDR